MTASVSRLTLTAAGMLRLTLIVLLAACAFAPAALATPQHPRASLTDIEADLMCTSCREPLAVAQSPQADSERAYIRTLIAQGLGKRQIEQDMVAQYGEAVLAKPPASGFNLTVYVLPPLILAAGLAILLVALPRWRRRARGAPGSGSAPATAVDPAEAARLDYELGQFRG